MTTELIDANIELRRLSYSDYELYAALFTMLVREGYFSNGSFEEIYSDGQVMSVIEGMIELIIKFLLVCAMKYL